MYLFILTVDFDTLSQFGFTHRNNTSKNVNKKYNIYVGTDIIL